MGGDGNLGGCTTSPKPLAAPLSAISLDRQDDTMSTIVGLAFCLLLGVSTKASGIAALLWFPLGFFSALFVTAQMILPIIMGLPRAIRLVSTREMRGAVFGAILITPLIWFVLLFLVGFLVGFFWPSAVDFLNNNAALNLGGWVGTMAIVLSPLSAKSRADFRADFDRSYERFYTPERKPTAQKQIEATLTVASNLYLNTSPGAAEAPVTLEFSLPDSRYRYFLFCLSATITAVLAYDERKDIEPDVLIEGCLHCAVQLATERAPDFFAAPPTTQEDIANNTRACFRGFCEAWQRWAELEKEGRSADVVDLICSMIHSTETDAPPTQTDIERLSELALQIDCRMPTMRGAFVDLTR